MRLPLDLPLIGLPLLLCGCSLHPIPERVVGLETHAIVQKIRCEAQDVVMSIYSGTAQTTHLYNKKAFTKFIPSLAASRWDSFKALSNRIAKAQDDRSDLNAEAARLNQKRERLTARIALNGLRLEKAAHDAEIKARRPGAPIDQITAQLNSAIAERDTEDKKISYAVTEYKIENNASKARLAAADKVIRNLERDLNAQFSDIIHYLGHQVTMQIKFSITEKNTAKADGSLKLPLALGTLTVAPNVGDERERLGERTIKTVADFEDLFKEAQQRTQAQNTSSGRLCSNMDTAYGPPPRYPIEGSIGLREVFEQYLQITQQAATVFFDSKVATEAYTDKIQFKTTISGGLKPTISISQAGQSLTGNMELSGSRIDVHEVLVGLYHEKEGSGPPTDTDKVTRVQIVKDPDF